jgi:hypothetical protein
MVWGFLWKNCDNGKIKIYVLHADFFNNAKKLKKRSTVKLGYNELGYNEHSVITNK